MNIQNMSIVEALQTVENIQQMLQGHAEQFGGDTELSTLKELHQAQLQANNRLEEINNATKELTRVSGNEVKKIKGFVLKRVDELMTDYEGSRARKIIFGNLQGYLYRRYNVNKHEDFLKSNYANIQDDIKYWVPTGKVKEKLKPYAVTCEQAELLDGDIE